MDIVDSKNYSIAAVEPLSGPGFKVPLGFVAYVPVVDVKVLSTYCVKKLVDFEEPSPKMFFGNMKTPV